MSEPAITKVNDYTISEQTEFGHAKVTKLFNYQARQLTTILVDEVQAGSYDGGAGAAVAMTKENFDNVQSSGEINLMRDKLIALGGNPPEAFHVSTARHIPQ